STAPGRRKRQGMSTTSLPIHPLRRFCRNHRDRPSIRRLVAGNIIAFLISVAWPVQENWAQAMHNDQNSSGNLKKLNLEELGNVEVTTASKAPETVWRTPAAIYVLTQEDIRRSGATSLAELLRLVPGVEVGRTDSDTWAVGVRGF